MPQPRKHESDADRKIKWDADHVDRIPLNVRRDASINKEVIKRAADASGLSTATFIMRAIAKYILDTLGPEWLAENENKPDEK